MRPPPYPFALLDAIQIHLASHWVAWVVSFCRTIQGTNIADLARVRQYLAKRIYPITNGVIRACAVSLADIRHLDDDCPVIGAPLTAHLGILSQRLAQVCRDEFALGDGCDVCP